MIFIYLTPQQVDMLKDNYILEIQQRMRRPVNVKIDDGFIEQQNANVVCLNIFHVNTLVEKGIVKTNQHNTDVLIELIFMEKQFQAYGDFKHEIQ